MMRSNLLTLVAIFVLFFYSCIGETKDVRINEIIINAPFEMPAIKVPDFSDCPRYSISDYGAIQGNHEKVSIAIANAISKAHERGGGVVVIPKGRWRTGAIHLKSNVDLHLDEGAVLVFSRNPADSLPAVSTSW